MMKRMLSACLIIMLISGIAISGNAEEKRPFDDRADSRFLVEIRDLAFEWLSEVADFTTDEKLVLMSISMAWCNLLHGELLQNTPIDETMAADIYRGFRDGAAVACLTASDSQNEYFNVLFAVQWEGMAGQAFWIEWDVEKNVIRAFKQYGVDLYRNDEDYLGDLVFNSLLAKSMGGNALLGAHSVSPNALQFAYGRDVGILQMFDWAYGRANSQESVPIK